MRPPAVSFGEILIISGTVAEQLYGVRSPQGHVCCPRLVCSSCVWVPQILTRPLSIDLVLGEDVEGGPLQGTQTAAGA